MCAGWKKLLIRTCADYGIATERVAGMTGVWTQMATADRARAPASASKATL